jgi:microcystin-dependent protein
MKSDSLGFLIPRMSSYKRQQINKPSEPANSLLVYDTIDATFYYYDSINNNGNDNWTGISPWRYRDNLSNRYVNLHESVRSVGVNMSSPDRANLFTVKGSVVVGDSVSVAPEEGLLVLGDVKTGSATIKDTLFSTTLEGRGTIPVGGIIVWSGDINSIPENWALCDGRTVGSVLTPDLSGRFIVGYDPNGSETPNNAQAKEINTGKIGNTGGEEFHVLLTSEMPSHSHNVEEDTMDYHQHTYDDKYSGTGKLVILDVYDHGTNGLKSRSSPITANGGEHSHGINSAGSGETHENRPPYYVLSYIIRVL